MEKYITGLPKWTMFVLFVAILVFYLAGGWNSYRSSQLISKKLDQADANPNQNIQ